MVHGLLDHVLLASALLVLVLLVIVMPVFVTVRVDSPGCKSFAVVLLSIAS